MMTMNVFTERLVLRGVRESDLTDLCEYLSDPQVVAFEPYKPMTMKGVKDNLDWRISTEEMIAVEMKSTGKLIGNIYLGKRDYDALEIGFVFNQNYQHQGYARGCPFRRIPSFMGFGIATAGLGMRRPRQHGYPCVCDQPKIGGTI